MLNIYNRGIILKRCPICGKKPELVIDYNKDNINNKIYYCKGYWTTHFKGKPKSTKKDARISWNKMIEADEIFVSNRIDEMNKNTIDTLFGR